MARISRQQYAELYGPTVGDRFRLADTALVCQVEQDLLTYGDELVFGGGKTARDGMRQAPEATSRGGALDLVITNAIIMDPILGIVKGDIGVRAGHIVAIGKSGNPGVMDGVHPDLVVGPGTEVIAGEHLIATPGGIDAHIHMISPQQVWHALSNGVTTMIGSGTWPRRRHQRHHLHSGPLEHRPDAGGRRSAARQLGPAGQGQCQRRRAPGEQLEAGASGLKLHEDWGTTPAAIDRCLEVADRYDVPVAIHTDTLNEAGFVEDTIAAIAGRAIHTYHTEGAGGGHAPDIIKIAAELNVLPSSTNSTRPYTVNTLAEHMDMLMVCHHLNPRVPEDVAFAESRIRSETMAAEDVLHDMGVHQHVCVGFASHGPGGRKLHPSLPDRRQNAPIQRQAAEDSPDHDNFRVLRYLAKLTINPAVTHGISHLVG